MQAKSSIKPAKSWWSREWEWEGQGTTQLHEHSQMKEMGSLLDRGGLLLGNFGLSLGGGKGQHVHTIC